MDEQTKEKYIAYQAQLVATGVVILSLLITLWIILENMYVITHQDEDNEERLERIHRWSKIASLLYLIAASYFFYQTWYDKKMNPTKANQWFFLAATLAFLAAYIRFYYQQETSGDVQAQDII